MTVIQQLPNDPLHAHYQRMVDKGIKPTLARLTLARRIASTGLSVALLVAGACAHGGSARTAIGFWEVSSGQEHAGFDWLAIYPGETSGTFDVVWDTGLTCVTEIGRSVENTVEVSIGGSAARMALRGASAELSFLSHRSRRVQLRKSGKAPSLVCE